MDAICALKGNFQCFSDVSQSSPTKLTRQWAPDSMSVSSCPVLGLQTTMPVLLPLPRSSWLYFSDWTVSPGLSCILLCRCLFLICYLFTFRGKTYYKNDHLNIQFSSSKYIHTVFFFLPITPAMARVFHSPKLSFLFHYEAVALHFSISPAPLWDLLLCLL